MDANQQKEQFSRAYVHAVASVAGFSLYEPSVDDDSIDLGFARRGGADGDCICSPRVEAQLKCTSRDVIGDESLSFDLKVKNYNELCPENFLVPRILIVVVVPDSMTDWLTHTEKELVLRRCAWWISLRGQPKSTNTSTERTHIPRAQVFSPQALTSMMERIAAGETP